MSGLIPRGAPAPQPVAATDAGPDYGYGKRADGSNKGDGYFGKLQRPDGRVSTEISVGMEIGGKETEVPLLVPTLTKKEKDYLLSRDEKKLDFKSPEMQPILDKAEAFARKRMRSGKSPFAAAEDMLR